LESQIKLCECGCGNPAPIAKGNKRSKGLVKGQPLRFISGHHGSTLRPDIARSYRSAAGRTHHITHAREYMSYSSAKSRCTNQKDTFHWKDYGGRGIKFLFTSFEQFFAELGPRPEGTTLDRYPNNDGNYEPGNVRWATHSEQQLNRRSRRAA
jgi:hypothetical protein